MNGGRLGRRNVPGVDSMSGVYSLREMADLRRKGIWWDAIDLFDSDTTAHYTQTADTAATWAIANGELVATGGNQAIFTRNGASYTDVAVEADVSWAHSGGLVLRVVDNSNYYLVALADDTSSATINIQVFKRVAGPFTQIGSNVDIGGWPRGMTRRFRFTAVGTTLKVYVDDWEVFSAVDSAHAGPGGVGMRNFGGGTNASKYQAFRYKPL